MPLFARLRNEECLGLVSKNWLLSQKRSACSSVLSHKTSISVSFSAYRKLGISWENGQNDLGFHVFQFHTACE